MKICGKAHVYGHHIDTDVIIPARYLTTSDPSLLAPYCLIDLDPSFSSRVRPGDILVAGENFGCGSSREHAPIALKGAGIHCVVAASFARIFYRNAFNIGLPILECPAAASAIQQGALLSIDLVSGTLTDEETGIQYIAKPLPEFMQNMLQRGGLMASLKIPD